MTVVLQWVQLPPPVVLQWVGPDGSLSPIPALPTPPTIAAIVGPKGDKGDTGPQGIMGGSGVFDTVHCTAGGSADAITLSNIAPYAVANSMQELSFYAVGPNTGGSMTLVHPSINGGAAAPLVLPGGTTPPKGAVGTGWYTKVVWVPSQSKYVLISSNYQQQATEINLTYISCANGRSIIAALPPGATITSDYSGIEFSVTMPNGKTSYGSPDISIVKSDGVTLIVQRALHDKYDAGSLINIGAWGKSDTLRFKLSPTSQWMLTGNTDTISAPIMQMFAELTTPGAIKNPDRCVSFYKLEGYNYAAEFYIPTAAYKGSGARRQPDKVRVTFRDTGLSDNANTVPFSNLTMLGWQIYAPSSDGSHAWWDCSNFLFDHIDGGVEADGGLVDSLFEPVIVMGNYTTPTATTGYTLTGDVHGNQTNVSYTVSGIQNDASTGNTNVTTTLSLLPNGPIFKGKSVSSVATMNLTYSSGTTVSGQVAALKTKTHTLESVTDHLVRVQTTYDFTVAASGTTPGYTSMYVGMFPFRDCDMAYAIIGGVAPPAFPISGTVQINVATGTYGSVTVSAGTNGGLDVDAIGLYNSNNPNVKIIVTNNAGVGKSHFVNGTAVARTDPWLILPQPTYGGKLYGSDSRGTTNAKSLAATVLGFDFCYRILIGNAYV